MILFTCLFCYFIDIFYILYFYIQDKVTLVPEYEQYFFFHSRAIIKLGPLIYWNLCIPINNESSIHSYPKGNFPR